MGFEHVRALPQRERRLSNEPMLNVFVKDSGTVRHFWGSELVFAPEDPGQHHRGLDFIDPVCGLLDTPPEGRGEQFFPSVGR